MRWLRRRQRAGRPRQRQVLEADVVQEFQAVADLLEDARRDLGLLGREGPRDLLEPDVGVTDREIADLADVLAADLDGERLRFQAIAVAGVAGVRALVARQLLAHPLAVGLAPAPLDVADHALERLLGLVAPEPVLVDEGDLLVARAEQDDVLHGLRQLLPRRRHRHLVLPGDGFQRLLIIGRGGAGLGPGIDRAVTQAERAVRHHQLGLELQLRAEPVAFGAGAGGCVEREDARLDLLDGETRHWTRKPRRQRQALVRRVLVLQDFPLPVLHGVEG